MGGGRTCSLCATAEMRYSERCSMYVARPKRVIITVTIRCRNSVANTSSLSLCRNVSEVVGSCFSPHEGSPLASRTQCVSVVCPTWLRWHRTVPMLQQHTLRVEITAANQVNTAARFTETYLNNVWKCNVKAFVIKLEKLRKPFSSHIWLSLQG